MSDTLISLVQKNFNSKNSAVSYFVDNKWTYYSYEEVTGGASIVTDRIQSLQNESPKGVYIGLHLNVTQTLPSVVLGVLQSGNAFVCFEPSDKSCLENSLLKRLAISIIISNTSASLEDEGFERKAKFCLLGETVNIWTSGVVRNVQNNISSLAYAIQTSGSTGDPKIVHVPHESIVPNIIDLSTSFKITHEDVIYFGTPITFDPSVVELFLALANGSRLCIVERSIRDDPGKLLDVLFPTTGSVITFLQTTPSLFRRWPLNVLRSRIFEPKSIFRLLLLGGESFPTNCLTQWDVREGIDVYNIYGITEVSCWASLNLVNGSRDAVDIGRPLLQTVLSLRDCDENGIGEMFIGSNTRICTVNEECTSIILKNEFVYRPTGDLFEEINGAYYFVGRKDSVLKKWGTKVDLRKTESRAKSYRGVNTAICICDILNDLPTICLFVVPNIDETFNEESFRIFLRKDLSKETMPDVIIALEQIPLTNHGKLNHSALKLLIRENTCPDPLLKFLQMWEHYTHKVPPQVDDNFLDSGGDSFSALQITSTLESNFKTVPESLLGLLLRRGSTLEQCCLTVMLHDSYADIITDSAGKYGKFESVILALKDNTTSAGKKYCAVPTLLKGYPQKMTNQISEKCNQETGPVVCTKLKGATRIFTNDYKEFTDIHRENLVMEVERRYYLGKCVDASPTGIIFTRYENCV